MSAAEAIERMRSSWATVSSYAIRRGNHTISKNFMPKEEVRYKLCDGDRIVGVFRTAEAAKAAAQQEKIAA